MKFNLKIRSFEGRRFILPYALLIALVFAASQVYCSALKDSPESLPDYDNSRGFILDYAVGDNFETLKPMFLTRPLGDYISLARPGIGAPSLEQYKKKPENFKYVIKLLPTGSKMQIVAIKAGENCSLTYAKIDGIKDWVGVDIEEYTIVNSNSRLRYNREYFKKIKP